MSLRSVTRVRLMSANAQRCRTSCISVTRCKSLQTRAPHTINEGRAIPDRVSQRQGRIIPSRSLTLTKLPLTRSFLKLPIVRGARLASTKSKTEKRETFNFLSKPIQAVRSAWARVFGAVDNTEKPETKVDNKLAVTRLLALAKTETRYLSAAIGCLAVSSTISMSVPLLLGRVIDVINAHATTGDVMVHLNPLCLAFGGVFIAGAAANSARVYLIRTAGQRIVNKLRMDLFRAIMRQDMAFFDESSTGELVNRIAADTQLVGTAVSVNISDGLRSLAITIAGMGLMFYVCPQLAVVVVATVTPVALTGVMFGKTLREVSKQTQDALAAATSVVEERVSNIRTVRAFGAERQEVEMYNHKIRKVMGIAEREAIASAQFFGLTGLSGNCIALFVLYWGGILMQQGMVSVGDLSAFLMYAGYVGMSVAGLSSFYAELQKGLGASDRLWTLIEGDSSNANPQKEAVADDPHAVAAHSERVYDMLSQRKTGSRNRSIEGRSKEAQEIFDQYKESSMEEQYKKEMSNQPRSDAARVEEFAAALSVGLAEATPPTKGARVCPTGGFELRPVEGHIKFDNIHFHYPTRPGKRILNGLNLDIPGGTELAVVGTSGSGKSTLGSLLLRLYDPSVEVPPFDELYNPDDWEDRVIDACRQANAHFFINEFPNGYETMVGEGGALLSGGQKQRIAIARAVLTDPKILLLDEATSALDSQSEHVVQSALDKLMLGRTSITIAHRLSTVTNADVIIVLDKGKVAQSGTFRDLMDDSTGVFKKLVERQNISIDRLQSAVGNQSDDV